MAVSSDAIIHKMMQELQQAKQHYDNDKVMKKHISHVQLLCDLILQEETETTNKDEITQEEMKAMIEGNQTSEQQAGQQKGGKPGINHDDANGNSIFDF